MRSVHLQGISGSGDGEAMSAKRVKYLGDRGEYRRIVGQEGMGLLQILQRTIELPILPTPLGTQAEQIRTEVTLLKRPMRELRREGQIVLPRRAIYLRKDCR